MNLSNKISLLLPNEVAQRLDDHRYARRIPTRSAAAVEIMRAGIEALANKHLADVHQKEML